MTIGEAIALGVVQGLTEFLPISSSGHLKIVPSLLGWGDPGAGFTAVIQLGTLLAVLIYFRIDISRMVRGVLVGLSSGQPLGNPDAKMAWMIVAATVPIVIAGLLFKDAIETWLRTLYVTATMLILIAIVMGVAEWWHFRRVRRGEPIKSLDQVTWADSLAVGLAQVIALIPGSSRSGVTITGALFRNFDRGTAARFSFLLSLPSIFAAGVYQLYSARHELLATQESITTLLIATVVSGIVGYASIAFLLGYLRTRTMGIFIVYRIVLGVVLLVLLSRGMIQP